jgi:hypothetical protein
VPGRRQQSVAGTGRGVGHSQAPTAAADISQRDVQSNGGVDRPQGHRCLSVERSAGLSHPRSRRVLRPRHHQASCWHRHPWSSNGHAERLIGSIRRECLDHIVVFGHAHLRRILAAYTTCYNDVGRISPLPRMRRFAVPFIASATSPQDRFLADFIIITAGFSFLQAHRMPTKLRVCLPAYESVGVPSCKWVDVDVTSLLTFGSITHRQSGGTSARRMLPANPVGSCGRVESVVRSW